MNATIAQPTNRRNSNVRRPSPVIAPIQPPIQIMKTQIEDAAGTDPRRIAENLVQKILAANAARKAAVESAAANAEKLKLLDAEIDALDKKVNVEDFPALHELAARRDQRGRLAIKFSADADDAERAADAAADGVTDTAVSNFFWAIKVQVKSKIITAIRPFVADDAKAARIAENCDCITLLNRHANTHGSMPAAQKLPGLLPVLEQFLAGNPPWIFGNAESTSTETNQ